MGIFNDIMLDRRVVGEGDDRTCNVGTDRWSAIRFDIRRQTFKHFKIRMITKIRKASTSYVTFLQHSMA